MTPPVRDLENQIEFLRWEFKRTIELIEWELTRIEGALRRGRPVNPEHVREVREDLILMLKKKLGSDILDQD